MQSLLVDHAYQLRLVPDLVSSNHFKIFVTLPFSVSILCGHLTALHQSHSKSKPQQASHEHIPKNHPAAVSRGLSGIAAQQMIVFHFIIGNSLKDCLIVRIFLQCSQSSVEYAGSDFIDLHTEQ